MAWDPKDKATVRGVLDLLESLVRIGTYAAMEASTGKIYKQELRDEKEIAFKAIEGLDRRING